MKSLFSNAAALFVATHGLIHLLGFAAYTGIALVPGLPYKTTLFGGAIDVGTNGIAVFGLLWGIVAVGLIATAARMLLRKPNWRSHLLIITLVSSVLAFAVLDVAATGLAVNILVLAALWIGPSVAEGLVLRR
jgi:hypothetical protein